MKVVLYRLRDRDVLKWIMKYPGRGQSYSTRTLAEASGVAPATIGHLVSGQRDSCEMQSAHDLTEALGVAVLVLFAPPAAPNQTDLDMDPDLQVMAGDVAISRRSPGVPRQATARQGA